MLRAAPWRVLPGRLPGHLRRRDRTGGFLDGGERPEPPGRAGGSSEGGDPRWGSLLPAFPALRQAASCDAAGENTWGLPGNPILIKSGVVAQVEGVEEWTRPVISLQVEEGGPCRSYHAAFMTSPDIVSGPAHPRDRPAASVRANWHHQRCFFCRPGQCLIPRSAQAGPT